MIVSTKPQIYDRTLPYSDVFDGARELKDIDVEDFFESELPVNRDAAEALLWYRRKRQAVYQDGIRLPIELCDIAPIGSVVGVANLFADSRLSYNVSRSAIDESEDKLRMWRSNVGMHILKIVTSSVTQVLDQLSIAYEWEELWTGKKDGSLARIRAWMNLINH